MRAEFVLVAALGGSLWLPAGIWAQNPQVQEHAAGLTPTGPASALAQEPSGQAVVTYQNGKLTIRARNALLVDVLRAVCSQTGAVLDDVPPGADERIFATLGPGRAREVLTSLLNDAQFDYVLVGSAVDPNALTRVMVFPKTKGSNAEKQGSKRPVSSTRADSIGAGAADSSQGEDGNALGANAVGSNANSPQVAPPAGAAGSDTPAANSNRTRPSPPPIQAHRRR